MNSDIPELRADLWWTSEWRLYYNSIMISEHIKLYKRLRCGKIIKHRAPTIWHRQYLKIEVYELRFINLWKQFYRKRDSMNLGAWYYLRFKIESKNSTTIGASHCYLMHVNFYLKSLRFWEVHRNKHVYVFECKSKFISHETTKLLNSRICNISHMFLIQLLYILWFDTLNK